MKKVNAVIRKLTGYADKYIKMAHIWSPRAEEYFYSDTLLERTKTYSFLVFSGSGIYWLLVISNIIEATEGRVGSWNKPIVNYGTPQKTPRDNLLMMNNTSEVKKNDFCWHCLLLCLVLLSSAFLVAS